MDLILADKQHHNRKYYIQDYIGTTFGRLKVLGRVRLNKQLNPLWLCLCSCGNTTTVEVGSLLCGGVKSCGCLTVESATSHGLSKHYMYNTWVHMLHRCSDQDNENYYQRGIRVCQEWKDVEVFIAWCESSGCSSELELDRKDNDKGYSPSNCRFTTRRGNNQNRRKLKTNTSGYTGVRKRGNRWLAEVNNKLLGTFKTKRQALDIRNSFIATNKLLNPIQLYLGE